MKKTKKSLVLSIVTLLLCSCMFIGSTFAWFTDTVSNTGNKIQAGTLDIVLEKWDGTKFEDISDSTDPIFNYDKWEPGYSEIVGLKVVNKGTLALKYMVNIVANGDAGKLAEAIDVYSKVVGPTEEFALPDSFDDVKADSSYNVNELTNVLAYAEGAAHGALLPKDSSSANPTKLEAKESASMIIVLHMKEEAGNEYQGLSLGESFDINVLATQYTYELDGFDSPNYDGAATYLNKDAEGNWLISNLPELLYFAQTVNMGVSTYKNETVKLTADIDLNNRPWTPIGNNGKEFKGTFDGGYLVDGSEEIKCHEIKNLNVSGDKKVGLFGTVHGGTVKNLTINGANVKGINAVGAVTGLAYYANVENCHVKNATVISKVKNNDDGDKAGGVVGRLSVEEGTGSVKNCSVENVTIQGLRQVGGVLGGAYKTSGSYDVSGNSAKNSTIICDLSEAYTASVDVREVIGTPESLNEGSTKVNVDILIMVRDGFSVSGTNYSDSNEFYISNKAGLEFFADMVNRKVVDPTLGGPDTTSHMFSGKTVVLLNDVDLNNEKWTPIGYSKNIINGKAMFAGTFDGNNHTIKNLYVNNETITSKNDYLAGLFGSLNSAVTVKNLTIENAKVYNVNSYSGALAGQTYNLDAKIINVKVCGDVDITAANHAGALVGYSNGTFENCIVDVNSGSKVTSGWHIGGLISLANAGVAVKNCTVKGITLNTTNGGAAGIAGYYKDSITITGNTVSNVSINMPAGNVATKAGPIIGFTDAAITSNKVENNTFTNVTINGAAVE